MKLSRSVVRIFKIMDYLIESRKGATLSELSVALDEPKTSLYDILVTATYMNYLRKNKNRFYIGFHAKKAGNAYVERQAILDIVSPILLNASKIFDVSVALVFLEKNDLKYYFIAHPDNAVTVARQDSPIGFIHASASGKIILATTSEYKRKKILSALTYYQFTDKTIIHKQALLKELEQVQKQGYAVDNREYSCVLQCIAAPILKENDTIAAISFSSLNLFVGSPDQMASNVKNTAKEISYLLSQV